MTTTFSVYLDAAYAAEKNTVACAGIFYKPNQEKIKEFSYIRIPDTYEIYDDISIDETYGIIDAVRNAINMAIQIKNNTSKPDHLILYVPNLDKFKNFLTNHGNHARIVMDYNRLTNAANDKNLKIKIEQSTSYQQHHPAKNLAEQTMFDYLTRHPHYGEIKLEEDRFLVFEPEDWSKDEWNTLCRAFGLIPKQTERITVHGLVKYYGLEKNEQ